MSFDTRSILSNGKETVHLIEDLPDNELIKVVEDLQAETQRMELENQIFENFLNANEPSLIAGMAATLEAVRKMQQGRMKPTPPPTFSAPEGVSLTPVTQSRASLVPSNTSSADVNVKSSVQSQSKGPLVNTSQKTDLVMREIEETQNSLQKFIKISHKKSNKLKAEIEESNIRAQEVEECRKNFEQEIVIGAKEKITQKIPAEKFVRYMQEWLKSAQFMLEKLRLRTGSMRINEHKLKVLLNQKEELGESVHEVDFEKLKIENKNFAIKIEQKNHHLLELKQINGRANLMLTNHKKILERQGEQLTTLKRNIQNSQKRIIELEEESVFAQNEVQEDRARYIHLKKLTQLYQVPDVMEYIQKKAELHELQRTLKVWRRKRNIQKISLSTYTKMMMQLTNTKHARASWYNPSKSVDILELEEYEARSFSKQGSDLQTSLMSFDILEYRNQKSG